MARLSLALLGPFAVTLNGRLVIAFESVKVRALLAYLGVESDRPHARSDLAEMFWPDQPGDKARTYLRHVLGNLKLAIADHTAHPPALLVNRDSIQLNRASDVEIDVNTFTALLAACEAHPHRRRETCSACARRLDAAMKLYRGDFLAQFYVSNSAAFEEWAVLVRERVHQQALEALDYLTLYFSRRDDYDLAKRYALRRVELDPWDEQARRQLMEFLWHAGQRSAALAQYAQYRRVLQHELSLEPEPETTVLYRHIYEQPSDGQSAASRHPWPMHLPAPTTTFVGREAEVAQIDEMLQDRMGRLVTITGIGGIGKTRLAIEVAISERASFADGVCFVALAPLPSADLIVPTLVAALAIPLGGGMDPKTQLLRFLYDRELLLILDNAEHLLDGVGLLAELLEHAPRLSLLITSRERLQLRGEWVVELAGLPYPPPGHAAQVDYAAGQLFLETARRAAWRFTLTYHDVVWLEQICRLVEGMPLGIELAAAWVPSLSCKEIAQAIAQSIDVLAGSLRDVPARHRSLRAVLDHSWRRLAAAEQRVLRRLAVFRGGFTSEAAKEIAGASTVLLASLAGKSLLHSGSDGRFDLHQLVRQYAADQLDRAGEDEAIRRRHAHFFLGLAELAAPTLGGEQQRGWLELLEVEHDNLRTALRWALDADPEVALRLAAALGVFWISCGYLHEGKSSLEHAIERSQHAPSEQRSRALWLNGWLAWLPGHMEQARTLYEASLALAREAGDQRMVARALAGIGALLLEGSELTASVTVFEEALRIARNSGDRWTMLLLLWQLGAALIAQGETGRADALLSECVMLARESDEQLHRAQALYYLGGLALLRGEIRSARSSLEEGLACGQRWSLLGVSHVPEMLARVLVAQHDIAGARPLLIQSLRGYQTAGSIPCIPHVLEGFARLALEQHAPERSVRLLSASAAWEAAHHNTLRPIEQALFDQTLTAARAALPHAAFVTAWSQGSTMLLEQAIAESLDEGMPPRASNVFT